MTRALNRVLTRLGQFRRAEGGNVMFTFAFALFPLVGAVGAAVDYGQASSARTAMQAALDATALMLSKEASGLSQSQLSQKATSYFTTQFHRANVTGIQVASTFTASGINQLVVSSEGLVPTDFVGIMGFKTIKIASSSTIKWGDTKLRVALVLDNTGSMASSGKMTALKTAATSFVTQMQSGATKSGDVYVSIIPFATDVNVGKSNSNQSWVDFGDHPSWDGWDSTNGACSVTGGSTRAACIKQKGQWTPSSHSQWNGCVTDRDKPNDTTNAAPDPNKSGKNDALFVADQDSNCPVELMPLSYNWVGLKDKIDSMQPNGNTNQAIGLQWGFQSLTKAPFVIPPLDPGFKYTNIIILLTDGLNTQSRYTKTDPLIDTASKKQTEIDNRTREVCKNIKAEGITLYTVQVNTDGDPKSQMLQDCASSSDKFFLLTSSSQMVSTFSQIATALSLRRIAK